MPLECLSKGSGSALASGSTLSAGAYPDVFGADDAL
jgi:hypothetical protein